MQRLRPLAGLCVAAAALTWLLHASGVVDTLDRNLRRFYYMVRGDRDPGAQVVLVQIDEEAARAWGPPPWSWARYEEMIGHILEGGPRVVAVLEPGPRALPGSAPPASLQAAVAAGRLILPEAISGLRQPRLVLDSRGVVEAIDLGQDERTISAEMMERAHLEGPRRGPLPVNFFGGGRRFPAVPAHQVAAGEIPARTFKDRLVVIGLRGESFAPEVPTPVGPLSPAEIHAQALHALADRAGLAVPPAGTLALACAVLILLGVALVPRAKSLAFTLAAGAAAHAALIAADYLLFTRAGIVAGAAGPSMALAAGAAASVLYERARARRELAELAHQAAQRVSLLQQERGAADDDDAFWRRFETATRAYLDHRAAQYARLEPGAWHLELVRSDGVTAGDVLERRRDIRRHPYYGAYVGRSPVWANRQYLRDERLKTLMIPLSAWRRVTGFWMLHFPRERELNEAELRLAAVLGGELSFALEERRLRHLMEPAGDVSDQDSLRSRLVDEVRNARQNALALVQAQSATTQLLQSLPVGILTASLWGEVETANDAMRQLLETRGLEAGPGSDLAQLLAGMTGVAQAEAWAMLRRLLDHGGAVHLEARAPSPGRPDAVHDVVLTRLAGEAEDGGGVGRVGARAQLVVTSSERRTVASSSWAWRSSNPGPAALVDVGAVVAETVRREAMAKRRVNVETPQVLPPVHGSATELGEALAPALAYCLREAPADSAARLSVEERVGAVAVSLHGPSSAAPAADPRALDQAAGEFEPGSHLHELARARRRIEHHGGTFAVKNGLEGGTVIEILLPVADRR